MSDLTWAGVVLTAFFCGGLLGNLWCDRWWRRYAARLERVVASLCARCHAQSEALSYAARKRQQVNGEG